MSKDFKGDRILEVKPPLDPASSGPLSVNTNWAKLPVASSFDDPSTCLWAFQVAPAPWVCDGRLGVPMARFAVYIDNLYQVPQQPNNGVTPDEIYFQLAIGSGYPTRVVWEGNLVAGIPADTQTLLTQISGLLGSRLEIRAYIPDSWTGPIPQLRLAVFMDRNAGSGILTSIDGPAGVVVRTFP